MYKSDERKPYIRPSIQTPKGKSDGKGGWEVVVGEGGWAAVAEGSYRKALHMLGTPRAPKSTSDEADADVRVAGGAARAHVRLAAGLLHARYSSILRASGADRAAEAEEWAQAAAIEWPGDGGAGWMMLISAT